MRRTLTTIPWVSVLCAGALLMGAVACSDDDDTSSADETSSTTTSAPEADGPTTIAHGETILLDDPTAFVPVEDGYDIETG